MLGSRRAASSGGGRQGRRLGGRPLSAPGLRLASRPLLWATVLLALALAMRAWLEWIGPLPGDRWSAARVAHPAMYISGPLYDLGEFMSELGNPGVAVLQYAA